ncbi:unnamed protein product [Ilex paraguariensis]|uniref:Dymeclin n=1 Tax=Ilex paraguariensis TaxID=185542 RepID=A0ABC8TUL9_9AQUA
MLETLYNVSRRTSNQIYMVLIILLILSQDSSFNASIHKLERRLHETSLGSLMVIILIRTVKYNLSKLRLLPMLETLYNVSRRTSNQIYMVLIILLILSQDSSFNASIHKLVRSVFILPSVPWYQERRLHETSLGSLMVIILIRTVKYNLSKLRLLPMLETLYNVSRRTSNQIYMVLIILLILSQDSSFNASIHKLVRSVFILPSVPWYQERRLHETSLGSLMVIILIRTVKYNLSKLRDVYLHTNCLATLANMAPHVHRLSAYSSQRLVSLFDMLARKYNKLAEQKNDKMHIGNGDLREGDSLPEDMSTELYIYTDFLRIVLEILNAILTYALPRNPEVVYAIMHRQEVFQPFKDHPRFIELLENIFNGVCGTFSNFQFRAILGTWVFDDLCFYSLTSAFFPSFKSDQNIENLVMHSVLSFIAKVDVSANTYLLHQELLNFMLITMSTQLLSGPSPGPNDVHPFIDAAMAQESSLVGLIVRKLLLNYITQLRFALSSSSYNLFSEGNQPGVLQRVGSAAASFVLLPFSFFANSSGEASTSHLADSSLNILLVLVHYRKCVLVESVKDRIKGIPSSDSPPKEETCFSENPYCKALENARDIEFDRVDVEGNAHNGPLVRLPFASLFDTLGMCLADETAVLLLYSLVQGNSDFLEYVLVRTDLDTLLLPMLETLYNVSRRTSNQIYMVLIILLILSQDSSFNASIHKLILPSVPWYQERRLHETSLGSLMVIILIRTVKYNLSKLRDVYLHTNCLATLANMAPHVHRLSAYSSQRLVSLFDMLARKYNKLAEQKNDKMHIGNGDLREGDSLPEDMSTELYIYTDFLRIVLEILNAILTYALPRNPEVVYAIMHRQEVFQPFKDHPRFIELLENIFNVLDFFNSRMDAHKMDGEWSVEKVLQVIIINCRSWRGEGMKMFTQLRFTYEQESHPEEFFIPYVWQLVVTRRFDRAMNAGVLGLLRGDFRAILGTWVFDDLCFYSLTSAFFPSFKSDQNIENLVMHSVLSFIAKVDVSANTYLLHQELLNFMLITMSTQLLSGPSPGPNDVHPFIDAAMAQESSLVGLIVRKLLLNYITQLRFALSSSSYNLFSEGNQPGVLQRVGSAAASFVLLPFSFFANSSGEASTSHLADSSLNILLVLVHYRKCVLVESVKDRIKGIPSSDSPPKEETCFSENPYCKALENARDIEFDRVDVEGNAHNGPLVRLPFASLFDTLGMCLADETAVLLLYSLVQGNSDFLEYVLVRTDLDTLDSSFNASIHKLILPSVPWYQERRLHETSLGSLMVIILIRTVKYNLSKLRDVYLHTNCLATLANMAPHVHRLSAYSSQRLVSLFDMLARKYNKLAEQKNDKMHIGNGDLREGDSLPEDMSTELYIYTDFLRIVLEILNAILTYALPRNPEVVYAIMHRQEVFQPFKDHPRFIELLENIFNVLDFFNSRMDAHKMDGEWSVEKVLQVIIINCRSWRGEGMKMFTQLRFTYEQESHPEEFFIPYVWQLVVTRSGFSFYPRSINLFPVDLPVEDNYTGSESEQRQQGEMTGLNGHGTQVEALSVEGLLLLVGFEASPM